MGRTNFEAYGIDTRSNIKKTVSIFAKSTMDVRRILIKTRPSFDVKCIYPMKRFDMQYDVGMLRKILKRITKEIEVLSKYKNKAAKQDVLDLVSERRDFAALIDNDGLWEPNMNKPDLGKYVDLFSKCSNQLHKKDDYVAGFYMEDEFLWTDEEPIKDYMLNDYLRHDAKTPEEVNLIKSMMTSLRTYQKWWNKLSTKQIQR